MTQKVLLQARVFLSSNWGIALAYVVLALVVFSGVLFFQNTTFLTNLDNVDQTYTWYQKLATAWHEHGYLAIWNANAYAGASFAGELQTGVFYPLNWLWIALFGSNAGISELAINYLVVVHFWIAAFGGYLLFHALRAERWAAFLAGATFAFSGAVAFRAISQTVIFFGLAFIPYVVFFMVKFHNAARAKKRWLVAAGAFLGATLLVGHIQPFFCALFAIVFLEVAYLWKGFAGWQKLWPALRHSVIALVVVGAVAMVVALPQLWVSAQYLPHAYRIQASGYAGPGEKIEYGAFAKAFNLDMHEFTNLIDPVSYPIRDGNNIFIGLAPLGIIIAVLVVARTAFRKTELWQRHGLFVKIMFGFSVIAMLGYVTWFAVALYELPLLYQVRQLGRYAILFDLALTIALAGALMVFVRLQLTKKQRIAFIVLGAFLAMNAAYLFLLRDHIFGLHFALQTALLAAALLLVPILRTPKLRIICVSAIVLSTAAVNTLWYMPRVTADTKVPSTYSLPDDLVRVLERTNGQYRVEDIDGALPLNVGNVFNVQTTGGYSATIYDNYFEFRNKSGIDIEFIRDVLGVEVVATKLPPHDQSLILYADPERHLYISRRPSVLPKMFVTNNPGSTNRADYTAVSVITDEYTDHYQKYQVEMTQNAQVIVSELAYPGWIAKIDGKKVPIETYEIGGYPLLKAIDIPAGPHTVEFLYKPFKIF